MLRTNDFLKIIALSAGTSLASLASAADEDSHGTDPGHPDIVIHQHAGQPEAHELLWHSLDAASSFSGAGNVKSAGYPGFDAPDGSFTANLTTFHFRPTSRLWFFDTSTQTLGDTPSNELITIGNGSFETFRVGNDGPMEVADADNNDAVRIGVASDTGGLHAHIAYNLTNGTTASAAPAVGAYLLKGTIIADGFGESEELFLLWNHGLSLTGDDWAHAVESAEALIPEPASLSLLGMSALTLLRRRRL